MHNKFIFLFHEKIITNISSKKLVYKHTRILEKILYSWDIYPLENKHLNTERTDHGLKNSLHDMSLLKVHDLSLCKNSTQETTNIKP